LIQPPVQDHDLQVPEVVLKQLRIGDRRGPLERANLFKDKIIDFSLETRAGRCHETFL